MTAEVVVNLLVGDRSDRRRRGKAGDECQTGQRRVVESPLQTGEDAGQQAAQTIDTSRSFGDQVAAVTGQQVEFDRDIIRDRNCCEIAPETSGLGDHHRVASIGFAFAGESAGHAVHNATWHIANVLAAAGQHPSEQGRFRCGHVDRPHHRFDPGHSFDDRLNGPLIVV